jgi:hypothetical protein
MIGYFRVKEPFGYRYHRRKYSLWVGYFGAIAALAVEVNSAQARGYGPSGGKISWPSLRRRFRKVRDGACIIAAGKLVS